MSDINAIKNTVTIFTVVLDDPKNVSEIGAPKNFACAAFTTSACGAVPTVTTPTSASVGINGATLGANVSSKQIELLRKYFNSVFVIADNDEAGGNMKSKIIEKLGSRVTVIKLDKQYKDIGDMSDEAIKNLDQSFDKSIANMLQ